MILVHDGDTVVNSFHLGPQDLKNALMVHSGLRAEY